MRKNRGFHGCWTAVGWIDVDIGSCEDLIPPVRIHHAEAERSSDSMDHSLGKGWKLMYIPTAVGLG